MINEELLMKFCHGTCEDLKNPFVIDGWKYFTDGVVLVRVTTTDQDSDDPKPKAAGMLEHAIKHAPSFGKSLEGMELPGLETEVCDHCQDDYCRECRGQGEVECDLGHYHPCNECSINGEIMVHIESCDNCCGKGVLESLQVFNAGGGNFQVKYLKLVQQLPGAKIVALGEFEPALITFNGGHGLLMQVRV